MLRRPKNSPLCPYTTLFRSRKSTRLNSSHTIISYCLSSDVCSSDRSEEHTSELQSHDNLVCRLLLEHEHGLDAPNFRVPRWARGPEAGRREGARFRSEQFLFYRSCIVFCCRVPLPGFPIIPLSAPFPT